MQQAGEIRNAFTFLVRKPAGKQSLVKSRHRWIIK
jgi:hypothetical protein